MLMDLNVNITVSLSGATLDVLRQFAPDMPEKVCSCPAHQDLKTEVEGIVTDFLGRLKKHAAADAPKPEPAQEPVRDEKVPQAAPETPAQAKTEEISDTALREAVKAAKDRTSAKAVREIFAKFNIAASIECPQERRSDLMAALESLK